MKKFSLLICILLTEINYISGQAVSLPNGNSFDYIYSCHGEVTHGYQFGVAAFLLTGLSENTSYAIYVEVYPTNVLGTTVLESNHDHYWEINGALWKWKPASPNYDTLYLVFAGENENLVAGSYEWVKIHVTTATNEVRMNVVAPYTISGPDLSCSNPASFDLLDVPSTLTDVSWQVIQGSSVLNSGTGNTAYVNNLTNGNAQVAFDMSFHCGLNNFPKTKIFHYGPYSSSDYPISGPSSAQCNSYVYYNMPQLTGVNSINWTWPNGWTYISGQNTRYLALRSGTSSGGVGGRVNNDCGQGGSYAFKYTTIYGYCGYSMILSPNPVSDMIFVEIKEPDSSLVDSIPSTPKYANEDYTIIISDKFGIKYKEFNVNAKSFNINIQNMRNGTYIITAYKGQIKFSSQFIINR